MQASFRAVFSTADWNCEFSRAFGSTAADRAGRDALRSDTPGLGNPTVCFQGRGISALHQRGVLDLQAVGFRLGLNLDTVTLVVQYALVYA